MNKSDGQSNKLTKNDEQFNNKAANKKKTGIRLPGSKQRQKQKNSPEVIPTRQEGKQQKKSCSEGEQKL